MKQLKMKSNYLIYLILILVILFKGSLVNVLNNLNKALFIKNDNLEVAILKKQNKELKKEYNNLLSFKNNLSIESNYIISNVYKTNYGFDSLLINGTDYQKNDEVINEEGLIGLIDKTYDNYSSINYLSNTNIPVIINESNGKIISNDKDNNLIIGEVTNYNNININDPVYSTYNTFIGKVIKKEKQEIDTLIIVKPVSTKNIDYVAVASRIK